MSFIIYKSKADLKELQEDSVNTDAQGYTTIVSGFQINVQPAGLEYQATDPEGGYGKLFQGFTNQTGIRHGMVVVVSGTTTASGGRYEVTGVEQHSGPLGTHYELLMRLQVN